MKTTSRLPNRILALVCVITGLNAAVPSRAAEIMVTLENLGPPNGTFLTPMWVGFHNGTFDLYDLGSPASTALERIAEDGTVGPLSAAFGASGVAAADGVLGGGPIAPGDSVSAFFTLDPNSPLNAYFSYASMVIPSNDAFIGNGNPLAIQVFDGTGQFLGANFVVLGSSVRDAGTELNDEVPANTAFFGQATPDTGVDENGVVHEHPGFLPSGSGGILDAPQFANADFTAPGYQVARVKITAVPESLHTASILLLAVVGVVAVRGRRQWTSSQY